jgi:hypothetical protein
MSQVRTVTTLRAAPVVHPVGLGLRLLLETWVPLEMPPRLESLLPLRITVKMLQDEVRNNVPGDPERQDL